VSRWDGTPIVDEVPDGFLELPDNGYGAVVGWCAGSANLVRLPDSADNYTITVTCVTAGVTTKHDEQRTQEDQDTIDDLADCYLAEAGIPHGRPRGFRWFVRLPDGLTADGFWRLVNAHAAARGAHARDTAKGIGEALATTSLPL
jgi:hypothetical protein